MSRQQQQRIEELLKKTEHFDADERYMAVHDLMEDIKNDVEIEAKDIARIRDTLVTMLNDKSGDVSTIATKSLAILVRKLAAAEIGPIVNKLASLIIDTPQASSRDTWTDGLKAILSNTPQEHGKLIAPDLTTALLKALSSTSASAKRTAAKEEPEDTIAREMMVLDILKDVLTRFGEEVTVSHDDIVKVILPLLDHPVDDMRKKANATLGAASSLLSEKPFQVVMERLIGGIQHASPSPGLYTFIQSIGVVSAAAGLRIAPYLGRIVPKLISFCEFKSGKDEEDEANQQLWENCLQTFQSILYRCPQAMDDYINKIIGLSLRFLAYDPLYADDSDAKGPADMDVDAADGGWGGGDDSGWGGDADGFDGFGDSGANDKGTGWGDGDAGVSADSDVSWRIRRAAVGVLTAFIHVRSDILKEYYAQLLESLLKRFKERDPAVKEELFLCCRDLLRQTVVTKKEVDDRKPKSLKIPVITRGRSYLDAMDVMVKQLVDTIHAEFGKSKPAIQRAMCATLRELLIVRHLSGDLAEFLPILIPDILSGVASADPLLKSDSLSLLHLFVEFHSGPVLAPHFPKICEATCDSVAKDRHPSSKAEGLRIIGVLAVKAHGDPSHAAALKHAFSVVHQQLVVKDSDEAVKQTSIASMATLLATQTALFVSEVPKVVPMFVDRLANVGTVTPALHAITTLANAPSNLDLSPVLKPATLKDISSFLRKVDVELKYTAATTLEALVHKYSSAISPPAYTDLVNETMAHISDVDLQLGTHVLRLYNTILTYQPAAAEVIGKPDVMNRILHLCLSPLVQASALQALLALFSTFVDVSKGSGPLSYNQLLAALLQTSSSASGVSKSALQSVAMVIAAMSSKADAASVNATVSRFAETVQTQSGSEHTQELALLVLGALGKQRDLSSHANLEEIVFSALSSKADRVRHAAAFALGNIAVGRLNTYVPKLLQLMKSKPDQLYLLLTALKELITACSESNNEGLAAFTDAIGPILLENAEHKEEGARGMAAECLGKLATMDGIKIIPQLQQLSQSKSAHLRAAAIMAVRFSLCNNNLMLIRDGMKSFLGLLQDGDLEVRRQSALTVNSFARNDEGLSLLDEYLKSLVVPILYNATTIDQTLVEVRDFGAFTETFDHGEPLRSAAFQCLATLLDEAPHRLNLSAFASNMKKGIEDPSSEIQLLTCHTFMSLAETFPSAALEALDSLQPCFQKAVKGRMNELQTGNQRAGEVLRSLIRTVFTLARLHGADASTQFMNFYRAILKTQSIAALVKEVQSTMPAATR